MIEHLLQGLYGLETHRRAN